MYAYRSLGDNVYGLSKLVPYGSILIVFLFLLYFFGCLRSNETGVAFGEEIIIFLELLYPRNYHLVLTFTPKELSSVCSYLDKVSSKSCKNVNSVMIIVFAVRCV